MSDLFLHNERQKEHNLSPWNWRQNISRRKFFFKIFKQSSNMSVFFYIATDSKITVSENEQNNQILDFKYLLASQICQGKFNSDNTLLKNSPYYEIEEIPYGLIQAKAYQLWESRGKKSKEPTNRDWCAALEYLKTKKAQLNKSWRGFFFSPGFSGLSLLIAAIIAFLKYCQDAKKIEIDQKKLEEDIKKNQTELEANTAHNKAQLTTDLFVKAIEQLGNQEMIVRLGGMYSLERIAFESPELHWQIMQILTAYIREKSPLKVQNYNITVDIQTALTIIARRKIAQDPNNEILNLSNCNLAGAKVFDANFEKADFEATNLKKAILFKANLRSAILRNVNLEEAFLEGANLQSCWLQKANLVKSNLKSAELHCANLTESDLSHADLRNSYLDGTTLANTNLDRTKFAEADVQYANFKGSSGLDHEEMIDTKNFRLGIYPKDFAKEYNFFDNQ